VECARGDDSVLDAFLKIKETRHPGLAVVNDAGVLVGNISSSDIKSVIIDELYASLHEPVSTLLQRSSEAFERPLRGIYCTATDNLQQVLPTFSMEKIHRLYIVDQDKHLFGVISLIALMEQF